MERIEKSDWVSNFTLIGEAKVSDYTFKIDEKSEKSNWTYNALNLGVDCGEKFGTVYCEMMGGYSADKENVIFAHSKDSNGRDDFDSPMQVAWEDRDNESILEDIGDLCFITVGLEKTDKEKTYYKKFLSAYDAIAYVKEKLVDGMVVNVKGNLKYSEYNGNTQVRKNITSIVLSSVEEKDKYVARFTQSILLDKDSVSLKKENIDKDKSVVYVNAKVLDYVKEYNGIEVKGQFPFSKQFEFELDFNNEEQCKKIFEKLLKVKKDITQVTFEGNFIEGGATVSVTWDDVPDDIKDLVDMGVYTKEEALARCSSNGAKERRMVLKKPYIKLVGDDDNKVPVVQKFEGKYKEQDLVLDCLSSNENEEVNKDDIAESTDADDMSWLNSL
jgi:hypothetical protein